MNPIISKLVSRIEESLKTQTTEAQKKLHKTLDMEFMEKTKYFEINAQSFASGIIDLEISQYIYSGLKDYDNTTLAQRIVITKLMQELLQKRISARN